MLNVMATWSPTGEGFRTIFRQPSLPLAEIVWRWSFGAAAVVLLGAAFLEYLNTLPVSPADLFLLRTGHPVLVSNALSHIVRGSGFHLMLALIFLLVALAILWIVLASVGRAATLDSLTAYIRERASKARQTSPTSVPELASVTQTASPWRLRSLAGLHFFRAVLALAACAGFLGALILAGFASTKTDPHPGLVFVIALALGTLVWMTWSSVSWFLSLASVFVVGQGQETFVALSSSIGLCRDRFGAVVAVGTWFGLTHLVLFLLATSVVTFPLTSAPFLPPWVVLMAVMLLTLLYFALVDTLYLARMAGYVAILEGPVVPIAASLPIVASTQHSALSIQPRTSVVDQDELILSDTSLLAPLRDPCALASAMEAAQVDQDERILSDTENISGTASESSSQDEPNAK
jgi:hypothetical protein